MEKIFSLYIYWDPPAEMVSWNIPFLGRPILWYGFFFAMGFFFAYCVFKNLLREFLSPYRIEKKEIGKILEKISLSVVLGAILGARIGDVLFYQNLKLYVHDPLAIFKFWEGGLASHGGILGIFLGLGVFCLRMKKKYPMLNWIAVLDLLAIPGLLAGGFIRIGNFFNQEIIGTPTTLPWAILFGNPADGSPIMPRHPTQLYESFFYFSFFSLLWTLRKKNLKMFLLGKTSGLFFMGTFLFRFLIEFVKNPQSVFFSGSWIDMGQILSLPLIILGTFLFFRKQKTLSVGSTEGN